MRVAFITHVFPRLHNTFVLNEMVEFLRRGHDLRIVSLRRSGESIFNQDVLSHRLFDRVTYVEDIPAVSPLPPSVSPYADVLGSIAGGLPALAHSLRATGIELLHGTLGNRPATAAMILSRLSRLPYTFETHTFDLFVDFPFADQKIESARFIVAESEANRRFLTQTLGAPEEKVHVVHPAPNIERLASLDRQPKDPNLVVSACRLHPIKGLVHGLRAVATVRNDFPDIRYWIIGDGPLRAELVQEVDRLGLDGVVHFTGDVSNEHAIQLVQRASVFMLPSVVTPNGDRDGTPTALAEAMFLEVPVISSRISGIPELVEDTVSGFLTTPGSEFELAIALRMLLAEPRLRRRMGEAGRRTVERDFNIRRTTAQLCDLWDSVLRPCP